MKILCVVTKYNYGSPLRGFSIEYTSFLPALQALGHEVRHFETWDRAAHPTYADLNRDMLALVDHWRPDVVFTVQRDYEVFAETLEAIAERSITLVTWITDDSFKFQNYSRYIGPFYDAICTTYDYRLKDYNRMGIEGVLLTQWAANELWLQPPRPAALCKYGVSFIGTLYGDRRAVVDRLRANGIDVTCFGFGWPNGPIETADIPRIMQDSVISLNFNAGFKSGTGHALQLKARVFEVPGAGGFLLTDHAPGIERYYRVGEEVAVFESTEDLIGKINFYLAHHEIRDRIAFAGFERTRAEHLYTIRLREMLVFALKRRRIRSEGENARSAPSFRLSTASAAFTNHPLNLIERAFRLVLVKVCQFVWGTQRGIKAARSLTFLASVKLCGARTFTSKSLPARLFPYI